MRKLLLGVVSLLLPLTAHAQSGNPARNYDFRHPMHSVVDVASKSLFAGWSGNCNTGRVPLSITLWRADVVAHQAVNVPATLTTGARPDAAAWLASVCNRPFDQNVGWSLVPAEPLPAGEYVVLVTDVPASWTCGVYPSGYPNAGQTWCDYVSNTVYRIVK